MWLAEAAAHGPLLQLPYWWDEAGYYVPAAYDFLRRGALIPYSSLSNAHPPLLSIYLASLWRVFGFAPLTTRLSMCFLAALALLGLYTLAREAFGDWKPALAVASLTGLYPVWFAQSSLAHADLPAAAATLWALRFFLRGRFAVAAGLFALAALSKEIAIATPLALALYEAARRRWGVAAWLALPVAPLALWFSYHRLRTGFFFGNPEFVRYNALATFHAARVALALGHRMLHLTAHLNLFVPVALALGSLALPRVRAGLPRETLLCFWVVIAANTLLFSILGGALLTRYLLPEYALVLLLAVAGVWGHWRRWLWFPLVSAGAFMLALFVPPPYRIAPEDTLAYADAIRLQLDAIRATEQIAPGAPVLTAWPVTDALRKPELGYVGHPVPVVAIDNFSPEKLAALNQSGAEYGAAIVFSTKYEPGAPLWHSWDGAAEERYFDFHTDLSAEAVARMLGGEVVWQARRGGERAAVLRFGRARVARV